MTGMLERVARALCRVDGHPENATMDGKPLWRDYLPEARAMIEEMMSPTGAMVEAGRRCAEKQSAIDPGVHPTVIATSGYIAMVAAALGEGD